MLARVALTVLLCSPALCLRGQTAAQAYIDAFWREASSPKTAITFGAPAVPGVTERAISGTSKPAAIHHIHGRQFVAGASLPEIIKKVRDYDTHADFFKQTLRTAALCRKESDDVFVFRYWATPYMDSITETRAVHRRVDDDHYVVTSTTTAVGKPGDLPDREHLCKGTLPGVFYMKSLHAVWRYEQTGAGVQIDADAVAELSGFALVRATAKRILGQILSQSLEQYKQRFTRSAQP